MLSSPEKKKDKNTKEISYKTNLYQNDTNYSIKLSLVEGKLQILIKSSKNFSEDIYEFSNTYSFKQLQITNKYFSRFQNIEEVCSDLDSLLKLKVNIEEDKDRSLILKIPTLIEKSSPKKEEILIPGEIRNSVLPLGKKQFFIIEEVQKRNFGTINIFFKNGYGNIYARIPKRPEINNNIHFPDQTYYDFKGENIYSGKVITIPKKFMIN